MDTSPSEHIVITCGSDGSVRCWDYHLGVLLFSEQYPVPARALKWVPLTVDPTARTVVVGFQDGIIRVLKVVEKSKGEPYNGFKRKMVFKPHNSPILDLSFSPNSPILASTSGDGTVFFFDTRSKFSKNNSWIPLKFVRILPIIDGINGAQLPDPTPMSTHASKIVCEKLSWRLNYKRNNHNLSNALIIDTGDVNCNGDTNDLINIAGNSNNNNSDNDNDKGEDTAVCVCSDGIIREYSLSTIIKGQHELSSILELSTYETIVRTVEHTIRLPVGFPNHHQSQSQHQLQSQAIALALSPSLSLSSPPSVHGYATPTTARTRNGSALYALPHTVCHYLSLSLALSITVCLCFPLSPTLFYFLSFSFSFSFSVFQRISLSVSLIFSFSNTLFLFFSVFLSLSLNLNTSTAYNIIYIILVIDFTLRLCQFYSILAMTK